MASGKTHSAMPSKLCPAKNKWFGWKPETWDKASFNAWMGAYHEASPAVFSEDLGSSPRYIDVGPQWGVEHGGCLEESAWYSVMAAGGLVAEQVIGVGPSARATTPQPTSTKDRNIPFLFFFIFLRAEVTAQTSLFCELLMEPFCHYGFGGPANYNPGDPVMVVELHNCRRHHSKRCHEFRCSCSHYYLKLLSARDITPMNSLDATSLKHSLRLIHSDTSKGASGGPDL